MMNTATGSFQSAHGQKVPLEEIQASDAFSHSKPIVLEGMMTSSIDGYQNCVGFVVLVDIFTREIRNNAGLIFLPAKFVSTRV